LNENGRRPVVAGLPRLTAASSRRPPQQLTTGATQMLIVNADDFGRSRAETDAVVACYAARRITSTTAMVFMADSVRAAGATKDCGLGIGLHLNLSERFTAPHVDERLQHMHNRVAGFLTASKYAILVYNPLLRREFSAVIQAQIDEFVRR
jgi:predicted glycoside hydrolase/deacetylase ChbG (UPF0249 family)